MQGKQVHRQLVIYIDMTLNRLLASVAAVFEWDQALSSTKSCYVLYSLRPVICKSLGK